MSKLLGGLSLCIVLSTVYTGWAQDPFSFQSYEPTSNQPASLFLQAPPAQSEPEPPIITMPVETPTVFNEAPLQSRRQNVSVRQPRTPAQEYITKRAVFEAQQRQHRMAQRKARGESLLRPGNDPDSSWWNDYTMPTWELSYGR